MTNAIVRLWIGHLIEHMEGEQRRHLPCDNKVTTRNMGLVTKTYQFQISQLEQGIQRCEEAIILFQTQVDSQIREKPQLEQNLQILKSKLGSLKGDELEIEKRRILSLEDNLARCKKNIEIYSQEVQKQKELILELQAELKSLKTEQGKPVKPVKRKHVK